MFDDSIRAYLKESRGMNDEKIEEFGKLYAELGDKERSRVIFELVGKELYKEYPADIETFIFDPYYLGNIYGDIIYPIWVDTLKEIYPAPFCKKYNEALLSCATRCFGKGTKIRMYDGSVKNIEDIQVGEQVMGPDSKPRTVLQLARGREEMYRVTPNKGGNSWICNKHHRLALRDRRKPNKDVEMTVEEFLRDVSKEDWDKHYCMYHSDAIEYSEKELPINPYTFGCHVDDNNKRIPDEYMTSSIEQRKQLLAGVVSTYAFQGRVGDNDVYQNYYTVCTGYSELAEDYANLARSLGFEATVVSVGNKYPLYDVVISGPFQDIPLGFKKKTPEISWTSDSLNFEFDIEPIGVDDFYGFTISGDHKFLLEDYTVVLNSGKSTVLVISALYELHLLLCMISPSKTLNIKNSANICFVFLSKDNPTACSQLGEDMHKGLTLSPYFSDIITGNLSFSNLDKKGVQVTKNILLKAGSSVNVITGTDLLFGCLDEANMPSPKIADERLVETRTKLYTAMVDRRNATFSKAPAQTGMIWLTSSPMDEGDVIGERINLIKDNDVKNVFILDNIPRWVARNEHSDDTFAFFLGNNTQDPCIIEETDVDINDLDDNKIIYVPRTTEYLTQFRSSPRLAIQEIAGRRTVAENAFFNSVSIFKEVFSRDNHIFKKDDLRVPLDSMVAIEDYLYDPKYFSHPDDPDCFRYIHLDIAEKKDRFGIASVYCKMIKYTSDEGEEIRKRKYFIDFCIGVSTIGKNAVDLLKVLEFIYGLKKKGYPIKKVSTDSHQGELARQVLRRHGVTTEYQSMEKTKDAYFFLKNLILTKTLVGFKNPILMEELAGLRENNKRVEKSKSTTDDLSDALAGACFLASNDPFFESSNEHITELINSQQNMAGFAQDFNRAVQNVDITKMNDVKHMENAGFYDPSGMSVLDVFNGLKF